MDLWVSHTIKPERAETVHLTETYVQTESCFLIPAAGPFSRFADLSTALISHANYAVHRRHLDHPRPFACPPATAKRRSRK